MLKTNWERTHHHPDIAEGILKKAVAQYSKEKIDGIKLLSNGCGNSNYHITFKSNSPVLLRIYLRDSLSLGKESNILKMLDHDIPIPKMFVSDSTKSTIPYSFSINQFVEGELMRDVVLRGTEKDIKECAYSAGEELSKLKNYEFDSAGFLTEYLEVNPFPNEGNLSEELKTMLSLDNAKTYIDENLQKKLNNIISRHPVNINSCNLVHGDYDPANIIVKKTDRKYKVAGILDWEFAFSGDSLFDVSNFIRYSHLLPTCYEESFISGLESNGISIPSTWEKDAKLIDLLSLLSLLNENSRSERPIMINDILSLIHYTVENFERF